MKNQTCSSDEKYTACVELLSVLFHGREDDEVIFTGTKSGHIDGLITPEKVARLSRSREGFYTNLSTFKLSPEGELRRLDDAIVGTFFCVLDDIGTKYPVPELDPTAIVESSEGNFQYFYAFERPLDYMEAKTFFERMRAREPGIGDAGAMNPNRLVRLPIGINGKVSDDGALNRFEPRLVHLDGAIWYPYEELVELWDLPEGGKAVNNRELVARRSVGADGLDYGAVVDPVLSWLAARGDLFGGGQNGFMDIRCPWHATHTTGDDIAGFSPIGQGNLPDHRAFHCFHEHCADKKTVDFLGWVRDQGGPAATVFDPVLPLVARYVFLEYSNEVADTWAGAGALYPITSLTSFRNAHRQYIMGERGGKQYYSDMWLEHRDTVRCKGHVYEPGGEPIIQRDVEQLYNTYRKIHHPEVGGAPQVYLDHVAWLIPDEGERELFHNWVAQKLQKPQSRSYAVVLVADLAQGEAGERYGTGRSTVGDVLGAMFQSGVKKVPLADITGRGSSQSAYNEWAHASQLVISEETKEDVGGWAADHESYERLKDVIDTRPIPNTRVTPKYGRVFSTTLYCNFLFFTNHSDALQIPAGDRRFCVLDCNKGRRSLAEYAALRDVVHSPEEIARVYHWYMARDISEYDHVYPPMTPAKQVMTEQSQTSYDEVWEEALELLSPLVTRNQVLNACMAVADQDMHHKLPGMVRARFKKLSKLDETSRINVDGKKVTVRTLRDTKCLREMKMSGDIHTLSEIVTRNKRFGV